VNQTHEAKMMRLIRLKEVMAYTGLSRSTVYKFIEEGRFPKQIPLGDRAVAWVDSEIDEWVIEKIAARDHVIAK